jgi:hypothetical protein
VEIGLKNTNISFKRKRVIPLLILCAFLGVILMLLGGRDGGDSKAEDGLEALDPNVYAEQVEKQVEELCNRIDGVSGTYAVVALKGGYRAIYASDVQSGSTSKKNQTVLIGSGSDEQGLLIGYENPEISGVGIVCSGGDDYNIRKDIIAMVSSAFGLPSNKIFVAGS